MATLFITWYYRVCMLLPWSIAARTITKPVADVSWYWPQCDQNTRKDFSELKKEAKFEFRTLRNPNVNYSFDNIHNNLYFTAQWNKGFAFSELFISRPGGNKFEIVWVRPEGDKISIISGSEILIHPLFVGCMDMWALIKDK